MLGMLSGMSEVGLKTCKLCSIWYNELWLSRNYIALSLKAEDVNNNNSTYYDWLQFNMSSNNFRKC